MLDNLRTVQSAEGIIEAPALLSAVRESEGARTQSHITTFTGEMSMGVQVEKSDPPESTIVLASSIVKISGAMDRLMKEPGGLTSGRANALLGASTGDKESP